MSKDSRIFHLALDCGDDITTCLSFFYSKMMDYNLEFFKQIFYPINVVKIFYIPTERHFSQIVCKSLTARLRNPEPIRNSVQIIPKQVWLCLSQIKVNMFLIISI